MIEILSLYHPIPLVQKKLLKSKTQQKEVHKGNYLLLDGEIQQQLYLVKSGMLILYFDTDKGYQIIDFAYQNRFCVDIDSFTRQKSSMYCIQCVHDCEIEFISYEDLAMVLNQSPDIERAYRLLMERVLASVIKKQLNLNIMNIEQRFYWIMHHKPELFKLVPHKYIASYINVDPTNFSKLYNRICTSGQLFFE